MARRSTEYTVGAQAPVAVDLPKDLSPGYRTRLDRVAANFAGECMRNPPVVRKQRSPSMRYPVGLMSPLQT